MKKVIFSLLALILLSGCVIQGAALTAKEAILKQAQRAKDTLIYQQAQKAMQDRTSEQFAVRIEQTSGPVLTLLVDDLHEVHQIIVHGDGYTQWIQQFEDRILCLTTDDGIVHAELLDSLAGYGDVQAIIECALDPVSLVEGRSFQRTSGAEEGSFQIATDNIDYWMKVSPDFTMDQVRLYFSDLPMMTMTYLDEVPFFPEIKKEDYPTYLEIVGISDQILTEKGYVKEEDAYVKETDNESISIVLDDLLMDYTRTSEENVMRLIYDGLVLTGIYTDSKLETYCEVIFAGEKSLEDDLLCGSQEMQQLEKLVEALKKEFNKKK